MILLRCIDPNALLARIQLRYLCNTKPSLEMILNAACLAKKLTITADFTNKRVFMQHVPTVNTVKVKEAFRNLLIYIIHKL